MCGFTCLWTFPSCFFTLTPHLSLKFSDSTYCFVPWFLCTANCCCTGPARYFSTSGGSTPHHGGKPGYASVSTKGGKAAGRSGKRGPSSTTIVDPTMPGYTFTPGAGKHGNSSNSEGGYSTASSAAGQGSYSANALQTQLEVKIKVNSLLTQTCLHSMDWSIVCAVSSRNKMSGFGVCRV